MATKSRTGNQSIISNQLSLFSDVTDAELGDNLLARLGNLWVTGGLSAEFE